jgi:hypothetical protein
MLRRALHAAQRRLGLPGDLPALPVWSKYALAGAALLLIVLTWRWASSDPNLARQASVTSSSRDFDTRPENVTDGYRYGQLGFHSAVEKSAWLELDLGRPQVITRVQAYGRGDCCFDQSVPLALEVSDDGADYRRVAVLKRPFTQYDPWVIRPQALVARFVRFRTLRRAPLVLSEVEVYGHPTRDR